jgi:hypothetical protein
MFDQVVETKIRFRAAAENCALAIDAGFPVAYWKNKVVWEKLLAAVTG